MATNVAYANVAHSCHRLCEVAQSERRNRKMMYHLSRKWAHAMVIDHNTNPNKINVQMNSIPQPYWRYLAIILQLIQCHSLLFIFTCTLSPVCLHLLWCHLPYSLQHIIAILGSFGILHVRGYLQQVTSYIYILPTGIRDLIRGNGSIFPLSMHLSRRSCISSKAGDPFHRPTQWHLQ